MAGARVWKRIEIEFSAGATAEWLSVKYGPAVRTIGARAKAEGWRKKDVALKADAAWDAVQDEESLAAETRAAVREAADRRATVKAAIREAGQGEGGEGAAPEVDLGRAVLAAQAKAVAAMEAGEPKAAQEYLKLARMLEGEGEEGCGGPSPQDAAALAAILDKLGDVRDVGQ